MGAAWPRWCVCVPEGGGGVLVNAVVLSSFNLLLLLPPHISHPPLSHSPFSTTFTPMLRAVAATLRATLSKGTCGTSAALTRATARTSAGDREPALVWPGLDAPFARPAAWRMR